MPDLVTRQMLRARNGLAYLALRATGLGWQTPRDLVRKRDKARLWRYRSGPRRYRPPVLIVQSLVSKSYVLDLLPDTSLVRYLVGEGFDVFLLDWMPPDPADAENTLETYVDDYIPAAVGALRHDTGAREVTLIGYCFGGILTLLATAGHPELPVRNLMVMATPCDYREMGFMSNMFRRRLPRRRRRQSTRPAWCPHAHWTRDSRRSSLVSLPVQQVNFFENLWNDEFVEGFLAISQWARDQVPFPGAAFRQTVSLLIRQNALLAGVIPLGRREARLKDIRCPFLNVFAEQDGITPAAVPPSRSRGWLAPQTPASCAFGPAISASSPALAGGQDRAAADCGLDPAPQRRRLARGRCGLAWPGLCPLLRRHLDEGRERFGILQGVFADCLVWVDAGEDLLDRDFEFLAAEGPWHRVNEVEPVGYVPGGSSERSALRSCGSTSWSWRRGRGRGSTAVRLRRGLRVRWCR